MTLSAEIDDTNPYHPELRKASTLSATARGTYPHVSTTASKELEAGEWDDLFTALEEIGAGRSELHLRSNGSYELRGRR